MLKQKPLVARLVGWWSGSLGFVVGAALAAWFGRWRGWWPASEARLRQYVRRSQNDT